MELRGMVSKLIYRNESNQYNVFVVETEDGDDEVMVGYLSGIEEGMYVIARGDYKENKQYGMQFFVEEYEVTMPDDIVSMERYLSSGVIKGIGEITAKRIVKKFGLDSFNILENEPERLSEIKGISPKKAREIGVQFLEKQELRNAMMFLSKYGLSPSMAVKIYNEYGNRLYTIVKNNPYRIAEDISGIGFKTADAIAMHGGIGVYSEFRIRAALVYTLNQAAGLGHVYLPKRMLLNWTLKLLSQNEQEIECDYDSVAETTEIQLSNLAVEGKVVMSRQNDEDIVYSSYYFNKEKDTARLLLETRMDADYSEKILEMTVSFIESEEGIELEDMQKEAVKQAASNGVVVITGGPGTGKTTTINAIIKYFQMQGEDILLAAPTGRAAKRMTEATGYKAQTIHRLLEFSGGADESGDVSIRFERNANNPLETDVIIIDEMSMVDQALMHSLMSAILPGMHLILVGDQNQLPSVGAGNVLKDIIKSGCIPVVELKQIFRQEKGSDIVGNAHKINNGEPIILDNKSDDFFYVPRVNVQDVATETAELLSRKLPKYVGCDAMDIQVLTPMRSGPLGVEQLNKELQQVLNPPARDKKEKEFRNGMILRTGDKVMQTRNNYKLEWGIYGGNGRFKVEEGMGVFNGDMGIVKEIDDYNEEVVIVFDDDKEVRYPYSLSEDLELSYAITIHKSQGSEYPAVILPLFSGPKVLMNRNLLYTAVTRARNCVVIVGSGNMVASMIANNDEKERYSSLDLRLKEFDNI
ncbi:MAG: ATP-dependent RecD-like DNA helicase [Lachnospiraceae bacterium]|jgi:exodeoxyribonuclease V alpha subunit|nr:ATP-dependent RecD-like DNA helicase [Lachnospiraceae bacterium]